MSHARGAARRQQNAEAVNAIVLVVGLAIIAVGWIIWRIAALFLPKES